jgi:Subtilase family
MPESWRVAIVDSGVDGSRGLPILRQCLFTDDGEHVREWVSTGDALGHGTAIADIVASAPVAVELISAQVLNTRGRSSAATVAAAISWALGQGAGLIHLSLGLSQDRPVLAEAVAQAVSAGVILVASAPARGARTFPAFYPGVIRATGDARCALEEISHLGTSWADFGACVARGELRGASAGAAHLTRLIVSRIPPSTTDREVRECLGRLAAYRGPERRGATALSVPRSPFETVG